MFPVLVDSVSLMETKYENLEDKFETALKVLVDDLEEAGYDPPESVRNAMIELQKAYDEAEAENFADDNDDSVDISDVDEAEEEPIDISDVETDDEEDE